MKNRVNTIDSWAMNNEMLLHVHVAVITTFVVIMITATLLTTANTPNTPLASWHVPGVHKY